MGRGRKLAKDRDWIGSVLGGVALSLILAVPASAHDPGATPVAVEQVAAPYRPEPPLEATPPATCGSGSRPETGIQGRVPIEDHASGRAAEGYSCNSEALGGYPNERPNGTIGGFKVERYVDADGRECAYYDTTLLYPTNLFDQEGGVNVLDMSDPANPVLTDTLSTPAMLSPHESLVLSQKRGLLMAVLGNAGVNVGIIDIYDLSADCRYPVLKASAPSGLFGHESGLAPDGLTFYSASPATQTIVAVDISDPSLPTPIWTDNFDSHGLSISEDGNRAYVAGSVSGLHILDTSEVQSRQPVPTVREVSALTWKSMSIPQNAIPVTIDGHPYLVEIDEFGAQSNVGAGRIIDIADETKPQVVSNLRLDVHQPENFEAQADDPGATLPVQGYAGHYCNVPQRQDPGIVACSMILSGLRVFDIRDPERPREIAYFNAPIPPREFPAASNWAMSSPAFVPERGEIWYSDVFSGFYAVRVKNGVWPFRKAADVCGGGTFDVVRGGPGGDTTIGIDDRRDAIGGARGDDRLRGAGGRDCLTGGAGKDSLRGGKGADVLQGGARDDRLAGGPGRDRIHCGAGSHDLVIADARDRVHGGCERVRRIDGD